MTKMETALASERTHLMARVETAERERDNARAQRDAARAERDDAKEWVHHATRMANERDEAQAERDALAAALKHLGRLVTAIVGDKPAEEYYGSMWGELRIGAAEAREALAAHDERSK